MKKTKTSQGELLEFWRRFGQGRYAHLYKIKYSDISYIQIFRYIYIYFWEHILLYQKEHLIKLDVFIEYKQTPNHPDHHRCTPVSGEYYKISRQDLDNTTPNPPK